MKAQEIVIAFIERSQQVCLSIRRNDQHLAGKVELPGGKVRSGEKPIQALERELKEELSITVLEAEYLGEFEYSYPELALNFTLFVVKQFTGEPEGLEGQSVFWADAVELNSYDWPSANQSFITAYQQYLKEVSWQKG